MRIGAEGAAAPAVGAGPEGGTAAAQTGIAAGAPAAGAPQIQPTAAPAAAERQGPRAEARAAETAQAEADATAQTDAVARPATGRQTIMTAQGNVGDRVGAGAAISSGGALAPASDDGLFGADLLATEFGAGETRGADRSLATPPPVLPASVQTPRQVTLQIAEMVRASGERAVELRLQPEELGRVQMTMSQDATGTLTVALTVERPETLDLLRRNIDLLGADLRALGYESVDFSFQGDGAGTGAGAGPDGGAPQGTAAGSAVRETDIAAAQAAGPQYEGRGAGAPGDGIDIRL